jgi:hypothetical protein
MMLQLEQQLTIENPLKYSDAVVDQLKNALREGVSSRQDPLRTNFYDLQHTDRAFFIYLSPLTGNVTLLAVWRLLGSPLISFGHGSEYE